MRKALWVIAVVAALALGTSIIGTVINSSAVATETTRTNSLKRQVHVQQADVAKLHSELRALHAKH
jgi:type VI protein secretion system component VasK